MQEHVHFGFPSAVFAFLAALVGFNLLRLIGVLAAGDPRLEPLAKGIGGLITFTSEPAN